MFGDFVVIFGDFVVLVSAFVVMFGDFVVILLCFLVILWSSRTPNSLVYIIACCVFWMFCEMLAVVLQLIFQHTSEAGGYWPPKITKKLYKKPKKSPQNHQKCLKQHHKNTKIHYKSLKNHHKISKKLLKKTKIFTHLNPPDEPATEPQSRSGSSSSNARPPNGDALRWKARRSQSCFFLLLCVFLLCFCCF